MEKKIVITFADDLHIQSEGFTNALELIGILRLTEAQLIEDLTGTLIKNSEILES